MNTPPKSGSAPYPPQRHLLPSQPNTNPQPRHAQQPAPSSSLIANSEMVLQSHQNTAAGNALLVYVPPDPASRGDGCDKPSPKNMARKPSDTMSVRKLDFIPSKIEDLVRIIDLGGCPRCGGTECRKKGKIIGDTGTITQKYVCKECSKKFQELKDNRHEDTYRDRTFEGKLKIQKLFQDAYCESIRKEMAEDELDFQKKMLSLQSRLGEKRRSISKLLDIPLEDTGENYQSTTTKNGSGSHASKGATKEKNPFMATIRLLRRETPKLEQTVARLLAHNRNNSSASLSSILEVQGGIPNDSDENQQMLIEKAEPLSTVDIISAPPSGFVSIDASYQLASRIMQDGEEEIEIFEQCTDDDRDVL